MKKTIALYLGLVALAVGLSLWAWPLLPEQMPVHFAIDGQADGWAPRLIGAFIMPLVIALMPLLLFTLVGVDPRQAHVRRSKKAIKQITMLVAVFLLFAHALILWTVTHNLNMPGNGILLGIGTMFALMGLIMPKLKSNFFVGLRTPWTLSSESNWHRTHRLAGWTFTLGGMLAVLSSFVPNPKLSFALAMGFVVTGALVPVVFSWWISRTDLQTDKIIR